MSDKAVSDAAWEALRRSHPIAMAVDEDRAEWEVEHVQIGIVLRTRAEWEELKQRAERAMALATPEQYELQLLREIAGKQRKDWDALTARLAAAEADAERLKRERYDLAHAIWHALDDSCEDMSTGEITIMRSDYDKLCGLVPADHEEFHAQFDPHVDAAIAQEKPNADA